MNILKQAKDFAIKAHHGQYRKTEKDKPMIIHPINVAEILKEYGFDDNVIAAGYLHDVVEDTKYTIEDIKQNFNEDIASLVEGASEPDKTLSWKERKTHTIESVSKLDLRHKAVIVADKINNLEDLDRLLNLDKNFTFDSFNGDYDSQKWYYTTLYEKISENETHPIFNRLKMVVENIFNQDNISNKYLTKDRHEKLKQIHYLKYELKNILNCLNNSPYVIEFTGTPRTGKTSIINNIEDFFKKANFKVKVIEEFTTSKLYKETIKPKLKNEYISVINTEIPKYVQQELEEALKDNYDIIIIDRSLFDRCIWIDRLKEKDGINKEEAEEYYAKYVPLIKEKTNLVIATYCDAKEALKRDYEANITLETRSFLNEQNVDEYNAALHNTINLFSLHNYDVKLFDTNNIPLKETEYLVVKYILDNMRKKYYSEYIRTYK